MTKNTPTLDEWRRLYDAVVRVKEIAPWEWMEETDLFGVQNPETDELGFVSVMGALGEHYSIGVYLGPEGLYKFWALANAGPFEAPERLLEIPQLQASFENRNELRQKDRDVIKKLGLKFRGRQAWPMFRSYRPGFLPWYLEAAEARFLAHVLEQTLDVALRYKEESSLLEPSDEESYLVRVPRQKNGSLAWEDQVITVPPPELPAIPITMDFQLLGKLKHLQRSGHTLEIDFFMLPATIQEKGARPYCPYVLMVVEAQSGMILGNDMLQPEPSLEAMWGLVPGNLVNLLAMTGIVPKQVRVRSPLLMQLLKPLAEELRFKLRQSPTLPSLDEAKGFLFQTFM